MSHNHIATPATSYPTQKFLSGCVDIPSDKSISHRAIMFASLATGTSRLSGVLEGADVIATCRAMQALGATINRHSPGCYHIDGIALHGFTKPDDILDLGNSGTSTRLLMGILAGFNETVILTGDASLRKRPLKRVIDPLSLMGCKIDAHQDNHLPLTIKGAGETLGLNVKLEIASAQLKSAILLAGLYARNQTSVLEYAPTRDHTENMLKNFGVDIHTQNLQQNTKKITLSPPDFLTPCDLQIPSDPSSAAFLIAAALIVPKSRITIKNLCLSPTRTGLITTLREMGADLKILNLCLDNTQYGGETTGDIDVSFSKLKGVTIPATRAATMIDEYPILAVIAAFCHGKTRMEGVAELRVKESNRLEKIVEGLRANAVGVNYGDDWLEIDGCGELKPNGGGTIKTDFDHRIAMSFLILGLASANPVSIDDASSIDTSFPHFIKLINDLNGDIHIDG
ncbi:MAG: 3-phosphoshikimate 1-carboxyvinyltransferase [Pseudomonadota bacterium]